MFSSTAARQAARALRQSSRPAAFAAAPPRAFVSSTFSRHLSYTIPRAQNDNKKDPLISATTSAPQRESGEQEGRFARTDESVVIEYPDDADMPRTPIVQGRGGMHFKRTLAQFSLENKVSLVTGGARGLGLVMAQGLVASGSDLAIVDLNREEAEEQAGKIMEQFKKENPGLEQMPNVTAHYADVSNPDSVNAAIEEVLSKHNQIDHLVTSAGFTENFDAISYPYDRIQKLWGVNVDGTYLFATAVAKHLMERKAPGSIVMIGSMSGAIVNVPQPQAPYNAAKAAVRHLAASLAVEWAAHNIRVNCISPGYMLTALTRKILDENPDLRDKWISLIPAGKMGTPEDLMGAVTFLLSDASKYITGADLRVDGGYTLT
ncbi:putative D-arabinitol dehydrogenase ArbD [Aspergillus clavatus NRRL 1]|uniref:D-arabinitol dehydrogenase ArbD, putative n=1 Tax=Aspergillus clavatus (strain ATCC 1007 / CBS 513.65 / DSM 816 / NCTC 3887 / NRRL 1 / QM 1276 / 107) TaxID=344612 RepID=A1CAH0_ASPCL|nr:D-arabinitol dehydrogenase ArbD, putative [Aspergillus clavatus NRRL 1]EAW12738.1 D-arabinitol dehydrogenase ArbD, putative [Aspergillus clavatus NRRL 1]